MHLLVVVSASTEDRSIQMWPVETNINKVPRLDHKIIRQPLRIHTPDSRTGAELPALLQNGKKVRYWEWSIGGRRANNVGLLLKQ